MADRARELEAAVDHHVVDGVAGVQEAAAARERDSSGTPQHVAGPEGQQCREALLQLRGGGAALRLERGVEALDVAEDLAVLREAVDVGRRYGGQLERESWSVCGRREGEKVPWRSEA